MTAISPTQSNAQAALAAFLATVLPGIPGAQPAVFAGAISGTTLTVQGGVTDGPIPTNVPLLGLGIAPGTTILSQLTGSPGEAGTYQVSVSQAVSQATMATGVTIIAGQVNRVPEPPNPYFAIMTPISFRRLATNQDVNADCKFSGSIAGTSLTVASLSTGAIALGATIFGTGVAFGTVVTAFGTGTGGPGTYTVAPSQTAAAATMSAGAKTMLQEAEIRVQVDFHAPDSQAGDHAQTVSTALRDEFGTGFFAALSPPLNGVSPLYADDPAQRPFINDQNQFEWRWSLDVHLQLNQVVSVPEEFGDAATITLKDVQALFPPH